MKTTFKTLLIAAFFTGLANVASAQLGAVSSVTATAKILKQITLTAENVNFGTISAGGGATNLTPTGVSEVNVGFTSTQGRLVVDATNDEPIRVTFDSTVTLVEANDLDSIVYIPQLSATFGNITVGDAAQATSALLNSVVRTAPSIPTEAGGTGRGPFAIIYTDPTAGATLDKTTLFIGGTLFERDGVSTIGSGYQTGTYSGTLNFNVIYQ